MIKTRIMPLGRIVSLFAFCAFAAFSNQAAAQVSVPTSTVYRATCASSSCHDSPLLTTNGGSGVGKILAWSALDFTFNIAARMRTSAGTFGNGMSPGNITARTDGELEELQLYLRAVRDGLSSPGSLAFGSIQTSQNSSTQTVFLGNLRSSRFNVGFTKSGTNSAAFVVTKSAGCIGGNSTSTDIGAATSAQTANTACTLGVVFSPSSAVSHNVNLNITFTGDDPPNGTTKTIALSGTGTAPPAPGYSYTSVGDPSMSATVGTNTQKQIGTIRNTGNAPLVLGTLAFRDGSEFSVANGGCRSSLSLTPNSTCNMLVTFAPGRTGARSDTLDIPHNAGGTDQVIVNGTGIAPPVATISLGGVTTLAFGRIALGSTSAALSFTIANTGNADLTVTGIPITQSASDYSSSGGSCGAVPFTVRAGRDCTVQFTYTPSAAGAAAAASLRVLSNANNGAQTVTLTGFGLPHATIAPTVVEVFPQTIFGETSPTRRSVTVTNPRDRAIVYARNFGGANAGDFAVVAGSETCPTLQVAAGASCSLQVAFTPAAAGGASTRNASLQFTFTGTGGDAAPQPLSAAVSGIAIAPTPTFDISGVSLALSTVVGSSNSGTLTISNTGTANLVLNTFTFGGAFAGEYVLAPGNTCTAGISLPPGNTAASRCTLSVRFTPAAVGNRTASLTIAHNATGSPQVVALNGVASAAPVGTIDLGGQTGLVFGSTAVGTSLQRTLTVRNSGTAALNISGFTLSGTNAPDFARAGTCAAGSPVAVDATCTVVVTFTPSATGARSASLAIASDASNANIASALGLSGEGVLLAEPTVTPNPAQAFPATLFGELSTVTRIISVSNPRARAISYTRALTGGNAADFSVSNESCPTGTVGAGASCTISVQFRPGTTGGANRTAALALTFVGTGGDPAPTAVSVGLSGTATAPVATFNISGTSLALSTVVGSSNTGTLTITNTGTANLVLASVTFGGTFAAEYALAAANTCTAGTSLPPGTTQASSCALAVSFTPAAVGSRTASLTIAHNATGSPQVVALDGVASATPVGTLDLGGRTGLIFGNAALGVGVQQTLTVRNSGTAAFTISGFTLSGGNAADFVRAGTCAAGSAVAANATCTVVVTFTPSAAGARSATLAIASDASNAAIASALTLSGTGVLLAEPVIAPNPPEAFPSTLVGELSSVTRVITVSNPRANAISYARLLSGGNSADFSVSNESCPTGAVAPSASCTISLQFRPTAVGGATRNAVLSLSFTGTGGDAAPSPRDVAISGLTGSLTPLFSISTNSLEFSALVGSGINRTAVITNSGSAPLSLTSLVFSAGASSEFFFATTNTCSGTTVLTPGSSCSLVIRFLPSQLGTREASVSIVHNATGSPASLSLRGTGSLTAQGRIELSSFSLAFADTQIGSTAPLSVTAANRGDAALTFGTINIAGAAANAFERGGSCQTGVVLQVDQECQITVTFRPAATGLQTASMSVDSNASNGAAAIALSGSGVSGPAPQISLPATLEFGTRTVGGLYPNRTVQIRNSGTSQLLLNNIAVIGAGFGISPDSTCTNSLAAGAICLVAISFAPPSVDTDFGGTLTVASNAVGSPHATALSGRGTAAAVPALAWTGGVTELVFGNTSAGTLSTTQTLTLRNAGPGGVLFRVLNAVGKDAAAFSISGGTCQLSLPDLPERPLFQGDSCTIEIRFSPASAGEKTATLQIASTGNFPPALTLRGTGLSGPSPKLALSLTAMTFEATRVGNQSQPIDLLLSSTGTGVIKVTSLDASGPFRVQNKNCPTLPFTLTPGTECTVTVMFVPSGQGDGSGTLTITSDALAEPLVLKLNGNGEATVVVSSGGCSLVEGASATDPTLWLLVCLAVAALLYRRRTRAAQGRADRRC